MKASDLIEMLNTGFRVGCCRIILDKQHASFTVEQTLDGIKIEGIEDYDEAYNAALTPNLYLHEKTLTI
jgi:hypothetical protein